MRNALLLVANLGVFTLLAQVGGRCEGCEAALEYDSKSISNVDTLPGFEENEPKICISGTVYKKDGKTPASNVILYIYHTNREGIYPPVNGKSDWARRHGIHRGWIKTGNDGKYTFYTFRPASYPSRIAPEHIHITVKEPNLNPYYLDDFLFDDDPLLTSRERQNRNKRGGLGIVKTDVVKNNIIQIKRDIVLGLNIPNY